MSSTEIHIDDMHVARATADSGSRDLHVHFSSFAELDSDLGQRRLLLRGSAQFTGATVSAVAISFCGSRLFRAQGSPGESENGGEYFFECTIESIPPEVDELIVQVDVEELGQIMNVYSFAEVARYAENSTPDAASVESSAIRFTSESASVLKKHAMSILGGETREESVFDLLNSSASLIDTGDKGILRFTRGVSLRRSLEEKTKAGIDFLSAVPSYLAEQREEVTARYFESLSDEAPLHTPKHYPYYPDILAEETDSGKPMRICIVTMDFPGPARTGGIGTWALSLAELLVEHGHEVKIAYVLFENSSNMRAGSEQLWKQYYKSRGIHFSVIPRQPEIIENSHVARMSYNAFSWLRDQEFDVVHFHEMVGYAFYSVVAKRQGLAFSNTTLCVGIHSPDRWHSLENRCFSRDKIQLEIDFMEKRSVECADVAFSPSEYLLNWAQARGWQLPDRSYVIPHPLPATLEERALDADNRDVAQGETDELVFFGRLESRKGLEAFCDAIDLLEIDIPITFLGTEGRAEGLPALTYLQKRSARWTAPVKFLTDYDHTNALDYIQRDGVLCVVPSLSDSTSYTLCECLHLGVPVIASSWGGMGEAVAPEDRQRILVEPRAEPLAERILACLGGQSARANPRVSNQAAREAWLRFHEVEHSAVSADWSDFVPDSEPLISVCIPHRNRPSVLRGALESVRAQEYPNLEVVVVDDGSDTPGVAEELKIIETEFTDISVKIVSQPQRYPGAARNMAAANASGDYLFFLDDDNLMCPNALSVLYKAVSRTGADMMTAALNIFVGEEVPEAPIAKMLFLGGSASASLVSNTLGDTFALISRRVFLEVGGFTEDKYTNHEDWELLARAVILGKNVEHCPEALGWYRYSPEGFLHRSDNYANLMRSTRAYVDSAPPFARDLFYLFHGLQKRLASRFQSRVSVAHMPQAELRKRFLFSSKVLLRLDGETGFNALTPTSEIEVDSFAPAMTFRSTGRDPQILLPEVPLPRNSPICVRLNIVSSMRTVCQLFYRTEGMQHFSESHQSQIGLIEGLNVVFLAIERSSFTGSLRLDPAAGAGTFEIRHVEIRTL